MITVLFDGTAGTPWGRYLDAEDLPSRAAPAVAMPQPDSLPGRVYAHLQTRPSTRQQLVSAMGLTLHQVHGAIGELKRRGLIVADPLKVPSSFKGATQIAVYRVAGVTR